ncbi:MAG: hypothetical protein FWF02_14480 [Micrococcales bacterium]|nr:hypothetical protein [Micrococcales bacterium]MCL2668884.1 hypothetical protein [Micrococcales bacterium]
MHTAGEPAAPTFDTIRRLWAITDDHGFTGEQLAEFAALWGPIPAVLDAYYRQLGAHRPLNQTQDSLVEPSDVVKEYEIQAAHPEWNYPYWMDQPDYQVFYGENQGNYAWAVLAADAAQSDPPVWVSEGPQTWSRESDSVSDFLTSMAHLQAVFALPFSSGLCSVELDDLPTVGERFAVKAAPFQRTRGTEFFGNHDDDSIVVMYEDDDVWMIYASGTKAHFDQMQSVLCEIADPDS